MSDMLDTYLIFCMWVGAISVGVVAVLLLYATVDWLAPIVVRLVDDQDRQALLTRARRTETSLGESFKHDLDEIHNLPTWGGQA